MKPFQELANAAAGTKFETVVARVTIQMTEVIQGLEDVAIGKGTGNSIVATFKSPHIHKSLFCFGT